jgi:uncharacterized protein
MGGADMLGDIIHFEFALNPQKVDETIRFYESIFGWKFTESFLTTQRYFMFETKGKLDGAFDASIQPTKHGIRIYVSCDGIDQTLKKIVEHHFDVVVVTPKTLISKEYGYYALIIDPSGNQLGIHESTNDVG